MSIFVDEARPPTKLGTATHLTVAADATNLVLDLRVKGMFLKRLGGDGAWAERKKALNSGETRNVAWVCRC